MIDPGRAQRPHGPEQIGKIADRRAADLEHHIAGLDAGQMRRRLFGDAQHDQFAVDVADIVA